MLAKQKTEWGLLGLAHGIVFLWLRRSPWAAMMFIPSIPAVINQLTLFTDCCQLEFFLQELVDGIQKYRSDIVNTLSPGTLLLIGGFACSYCWKGFQGDLNRLRAYQAARATGLQSQVFLFCENSTDSSILKSKLWVCSGRSRWDKRRKIERRRRRRGRSGG